MASSTQRQKRRRSRAKQLPDGCGYMGHEFGARYLDSRCFGGQLYDLDKCDSGFLYEPMDYLPCPQCNTEQWLEREADHIQTGTDWGQKETLSQWKAACRFVLRLNREAALPLLTGRFRVVTYLVDIGDDFEEKQWAFDERELDAELNQ